MGMTFLMTQEEVDDHSRWFGDQEILAYLTSLATSQKLLGKPVGLYVVSGVFMFLRTTVGENAIDEVLIDIKCQSVSTSLWEVSFYIDERNNWQLCRYVQKHAQKNPELITYNRNSQSFYNTKFNVTGLEGLKELFNNTFAKCELFF
ncbi:hypothetical protein D3C71_948610 [compost metagenome]